MYALSSLFVSFGIILSIRYREKSISFVRSNVFIGFSRFLAVFGLKVFSSICCLSHMTYKLILFLPTLGSSLIRLTKLFTSIVNFSLKVIFFFAVIFPNHISGLRNISSCSAFFFLLICPLFQRHNFRMV